MADGDNNVMRFSELRYYDGKIKEYIDDKMNSNNGIVDETLSPTSENAVQNKAILEAFSSLAIGADPTAAIEDQDQLAIESHAEGQYFYIKTSTGYLMVAKALKAIAIGDSFSFYDNLELLPPLSIRIDQMANTPIEVNSNDSTGTENRLVYLKVNDTSYKAFTLYDISHKNFCYYLSYEFQKTTDDEKYNLNFIGTEVYGETLYSYGPELSFINASICITESSSKTLYMPISSTVDFSNIYSSGPLANVKLTFYITKEGNTWYLNIKKSTPINLSTYGTTASLQILY